MRSSHGEVLTLEVLDRAEVEVERINSRLRLPAKFASVRDKTPFGYMFDELQQKEESRLPESKETRDALVNLGVSMRENGDDPGLNSATPSAYTYFGQFVDHDITLEAASNDIVKISDPDLKPLSKDRISAEIKNTRTPTLDLDSIYDDPAPRFKGGLMRLGKVSPSQNRPNGKDDLNDLPRRVRSDDHKLDRAALIGDFRNDENLVVAQLHVAFLRAHNAIVRMGKTYDQAKRLLRRHYQWIVIHDFLKRIADPEIVNDILKNGNRHFKAEPDTLFMPLEFSVAAFRFGHSMVRASYDFNINFSKENAAPLDRLFTFTALSGQMGDFDTLPERWIIEWKHFLDEGSNEARAIDTRLVNSLFELMSFGQPLPDEAQLSVRNLLRGYLLRLPTGQAVADKMGLPKLTCKQMKEAVGAEQFAVLDKAGFAERTPLWYYILAEAPGRLSSVLGPVGSTIVAEVLIGLARGSKDSFLNEPNWKPTLGAAPGRFTLRDLLRLGGAL